MEINQVTGGIIGAAVDVHRELGPGLLESAYEACLMHELVARKFVVERQKKLTLVYKGVRLDCGYRLDLLVERTVVVELKAVERLDGIHSATLLTYLRLTGCPVGLLLNFNVTTLRDGIRRVVL